MKPLLLLQGVAFRVGDCRRIERRHCPDTNRDWAVLTMADGESIQTEEPYDQVVELIQAARAADARDTAQAAAESEAFE